MVIHSLILRIGKLEHTERGAILKRRRSKSERFHSAFEIAGGQVG
jgi:hypothetical protein